jgi:glycosyltransferase involved in cell wall biosynthesis
MPGPQVSVIIPVWNGEATVAAAIESTLGQDFEGVEVVIVNDGSSDGTASVLDRYRAAVRIVNQENRGLAAARNAGAAVSRGEYLSFLDADDVWLPEKLAKSIATLKEDRGAVLAYSDAIAVDERGNRTADSYLPTALAHAPSMEDLLARWWPILPSTVTMRRETFERCDGFCTEFRRAYEDVDMWIRAREIGSFHFIPEPLVRYRVTPIGDRMDKYENDYVIFVRRISARYGTAAKSLIATTRRAYVSALSHQGLIALREGKRLEARRQFIRAWRYGPMRGRTILRLIRTFLPAAAARALSGSNP